MMRSLCVRQDCIEEGKLAVRRAGFARQIDLAEHLNMSLATVSNFLNAHKVRVLNFIEISDCLNLDWQVIADFSTDEKCICNSSHSDPAEDEFIYVDRPYLESRCYEALLKSNALVRITASGGMGKTALVTKIIRQFNTSAEYRTVYLNLNFADQKDFSSLNHFLRWFCDSVGKQLGTPTLLVDQWDEQFSTPKNNCTSYLESNFLPLVDSGLVLCVDQVDRIFEHRELASEFLGLLRGWHEQGKSRKIWRKLRLLITHSTEAYTPLNINESPFNVGVKINLPDFTLEESQALCKLNDLDWTNKEVEELMAIVGGHPYLLSLACFYSKNNPTMTLDDLLQTASTETGAFSNHLRHLRCILDENPDLNAAMRDIINFDSLEKLKPEDIYLLISMGIVDFDQANQVVPRCQLYQQYFKDLLNE